MHGDVAVINVNDNERDLHVVPLMPGVREHVLSRSCWCEPRAADGDERAREGAQVFVHNERAQA